jgi:hypothetical protein
MESLLENHFENILSLKSNYQAENPVPINQKLIDFHVVLKSNSETSKDLKFAKCKFLKALNFLDYESYLIFEDCTFDDRFTVQSLSDLRKQK